MKKKTVAGQQRKIRGQMLRPSHQALKSVTLNIWSNLQIVSNPLEMNTTNSSDHILKLLLNYSQRKRKLLGKK
jgi:hypothetical protein